MPREDEKARLTRAWQLKARNDLDAARRMLAPEPILDLAAFHCQQAAEKGLKAYLTWHDRPLRKTHDLVDLLGQCANIDGAFASLREAAEALTPYAVEVRYPTLLADVSADDVALALRLAGEVVDFVTEHLPPGVRS